MSDGKVLITGGSGVIGSWVVRACFEHDLDPVIFVRGQTDAIGRRINGHLADRLTWVYGDAQDLSSLEAAVAEHQPRGIIHMASAKPWQIEKPFVDEPSPWLGLQQITTTTLNVLEAARRQGVKRVVYASSKAVYDDVIGPYGAPTYAPLPATYRCAPRMVYGICKLTSDQLGFYYAREYGLEFVSIRFASSFGPLKRGPVSGTSPDSMLQAALAGQAVRIRRYGPGQKDDLVYNKDLGQGFVLAALAATRPQTAYNLGSGRGYDHQDIARAIQHVLPQAVIEFDDPKDGWAGVEITDRARCVMDISPAREDFGYQPRFVPLEAAFADFLEEERRQTAFMTD